METNKLIAGIVAAAIAIIVLAGVLMPALSNATTTHETFTNEGYYVMDKITDGNFSFRWDFNNPNEFTINGETIEYTNTAGIDQSIAVSDDMYLRLSNNNVQMTYNGPGGNVSVNSEDSYLEMSLTAGSGTVTNGNTTKTLTDTSNTIYFISETGDYVMKKTTESAYVNGDSLLYGRGNSKVNGHWTAIVVDGNIDDGVSIDFEQSSVSLVPDSTVINYTAVSGYDDLYKFDSITFDALYTGETTPEHLTYNYIIVPAEVTAERSIHLTDAMNTILSVIPILIIVAVLLAVVALMVIRRN